MVDALRQNLSLALERSTAALPRKGYFLATVHRAGNTDDPVALRAIMEAFSCLDVPVIFPAHPRTRKFLATYGIAPAENVRVVEPLPYFDMLAPSLWRPGGPDRLGRGPEGGLHPRGALRENTEWVETFEAGWNVLVGAGTERIVAEAEKAGGGRHSARFGDGHAAERIAAFITEYQP